MALITRPAPEGCALGPFARDGSRGRTWWQGQRRTTMNRAVAAGAMALVAIASIPALASASHAGGAGGPRDFAVRRWDDGDPVRPDRRSARRFRGLGRPHDLDPLLGVGGEPVTGHFRAGGAFDQAGRDGVPAGGPGHVPGRRGQPRAARLHEQTGHAGGNTRTPRGAHLPRGQRSTDAGRARGQNGIRSCCPTRRRTTIRASEQKLGVRGADRHAPDVHASEGELHDPRRAVARRTIRKRTDLGVERPPAASVATAVAR